MPRGFSPIPLLLVLVWGGAGGRARAEDERSRGGTEPPELPQRLASPFRDERLRAQEELRRDLREGRRVLPELLDHVQAEVRRAAVAVAARSPELVPRSVLEAAFQGERDPAILQGLIDALAVQGGALPAAGPEASTPAQALRAQLRRALTHQALESLIHDGTVPGFYDGQFQALWRIAPAGMPEELIEIALDDSYHHVVRVLATMALHETRRPTLEQDLQPLLMPEDHEFRIQWDEWFNPRPLGPGMTQLRRQADLSRYVRFALAKAGRIQPILRLIERIDQELERNRAEMQSRGDDDPMREHAREWLRGLLFESGYYFQQFDDFDRASERYLRLVDEYPESRACQNAYYNLACIASIRRQREPALTYLRKAVERGFTDHEWLQEDGDLAPLQNDPEFLRILEQARTGQVRIEGSTWLAVLTPELPPGKSLFELDGHRQAEVLGRALPHLTEAEVQSLLEAAPSDQRQDLAALILQLRPPPAAAAAAGEGEGSDRGD